jgi:hypothetical protein
MRDIVLKRGNERGSWVITYDHQKLGTLIEHGLTYELKLDIVNVHEHHLTHEQAIKIIFSYKWSTYLTMSSRECRIKYQPYAKKVTTERWAVN